MAAELQDDLKMNEEQKKNEEPKKNEEQKKNEGDGKKDEEPKKNDDHHDGHEQRNVNENEKKKLSLSYVSLVDSPSLCSSPLLSGMKIPDTDVYRVVLSGGPCSGKTRFGMFLC